MTEEFINRMKGYVMDLAAMSLEVKGDKKSASAADMLKK